MSSLLAKRLSSFFPSSFHRYRFLPLLTPVLHLSFSTQNHGQEEIPFLAEYLISSLGFSRDRALKVSAHKGVTRVKSEDQPRSVVKFLKDTGLSDTQISSVISFCPHLLSSNVEKTLKPKVRELIDAGFSEELLIQLIRYNPRCLYMKNTLSRLLFWRDFVGNDDQCLLKIIQSNGLLITYDIDKYVVPRMNLLNEYGLSNQDICRKLAHSGWGFMSRNLDSLRQILEFIEELGIPRKSRKFLQASKLIDAYKKEILVRKVEHYKMTYGWSQEEVSSAFQKSPFILALSVGKIKSHMDFLIQKAKFDMRSIASQPLMLAYSLEKRLVPRHHVMSILTARGLTNWSFSSACALSEKKFLEKFVEPYKKDVSGLADAYHAAAAQNISA